MKKLLLLLTGLMLILTGLTACNEKKESLNNNSKISTSPSTNLTINHNQSITNEVKVNSNFEMRNLNEEVLMTIKMLKDIRIENEDSEDPSSEYYYVTLELVEDDKTKFSEITRNMIGEILKIYVNDEVIISPMINSAIEDGVICISGGFSYDDAQKLVSLICGS